MHLMLPVAFLTAAILTIVGPSSAAFAMELSSPAFKDHGVIPAIFARPAAGGKNVSIPLKWTGAPEGTKSFALSIVDQHPIARKWVHWLIINIPPEITSIAEGASGRNMPAGSVEIRNSFGESGYGGPQPPAGTGPHQYLITVYALKEAGIDLKSNATLADFHNAIKGKTLAESSITGLYER
jgi:Raf kinase inhibitor-like YbhB/YbcL family protein